jgi:alkylated DNA repair protein (DNA oxidative demethylase)
VKLFEDEAVGREEIGEGAVVLRGFAGADAEELVREIGKIAEVAPLRRMVVPGGHSMSVAMTNCGRVGWVSDATGYRYDEVDPLTGKVWPAMPESFVRLAVGAAAEAGYEGFAADACLINRYEPGARMGLHQDKDERDFGAPIVSVSLGLGAVFLWGGVRRKDAVRRMRLDSGDVVVWGGETRLVYHGVAPLRDGESELTGRCRLNLTFRKAL